ncbi:TetR/AcrR family transcriptional regulator [Olivibacter sitiensis]|uniref:TetR/AcrR family transcriptional regulator n=1 Tax=Olivibacter sitiensis TaxID=376470 RepID=UPI00040990A2|nr:TetR/AcrR family transcriptional regulator [Olivibacter sitiensis]
MEAEKIKESIKRASRELFRRYGYNKTSVNEIAKKAKIAKATIYKYFESKETILHAILMEYVQQGVDELIHNSKKETDQGSYLSELILRVSRLTYTICNEFIGWDFIRESANAQEYLKILSDDLENLLINAFNESTVIDPNLPRENLSFLIKSSKSIVFSFAFTAVSVADVRKYFVSFQKEILPYLVKATVS